MPRSRSQIINSFRRQRKTNRLLFTDVFVMRPYAYYSSRGFLYVLGAESPHCERYYRANRQCELAPPDTEIERLLKQKRKLFGEAKKTQTKTIRLNKQRRAVLKRVRDLSERKNQNILKLELDKMVELKSFPVKSTKGDGQLPAPKALNSLSPRPSSFTVPIDKEGFTDPFLRLLNSPNRNAEMP
jgi:hypothetical protein